MEELHVVALRSGNVLVDGKPATLAELNAKLVHIKSVKGAVLYYRERGDQEPTAQQLITFRAVMAAQIPISLSSKSDFSDYIGDDGQSRPRMQGADTWKVCRRDVDASVEQRIAACTIQIDAATAPIDREDALFHRGIAYDESGQHDRAIKDFDEIIASNANDAFAFLERGIAYANLRQFDRAIQDIDESIRLKPLEGAFFDRGLVYDTLKQYARAIQDYDQVIALKSDDANAIGHRGRDYEKLKQYERAIQELDHALSIRADAIDLWYRGRAFANLKQYERAIQDYDQAITLKPNDAYNFSSRGSAYRHLKKYAEAIGDFDNAIRLKPDFGSAYISRGITYLEMKQFARALQDESKAIELWPDDAMAFNDRCWVRAVWGRELEIALEDCAKAVALNPKDHYAHGSRAFVYLRKGNYKAAIMDADAAIGLDKDDADAWLIRGIAKRKSGDEESGRADITAAGKLDPKIVETYAGYGMPI